MLNLIQPSKIPDASKKSAIIQQIQLDEENKLRLLNKKSVIKWVQSKSKVKDYINNIEQLARPSTARGGN